MSRPITVGAAVGLLFWLAFTSTVLAAGTLAPTDSSRQPIRIVDHLVEVQITNGFSRTEVTQVFENPNRVDVEGVYVLPLPRSAALAEMTIEGAGETLYGEVIPRRIAEEIYAEQLRRGGPAGLATQSGYQRFEFRVTPIPASGRVTMRFVYYQPSDVDGGTGRWLYPLEEGDTVEPVNPIDEIHGTFRVHVDIQTSWPMTRVWVPGHPAAVVTGSNAEGWDMTLEGLDQLDRDVVLQYELDEAEPGRMDLVAYRPESGRPGTFMLLLTPGADLAPVGNGADYVLVLDVSGSMEGKLDTLKSAVNTFLRSLEPADRFRIVKFSAVAQELTPGWVRVGGDSVRTWTDHVHLLEIESNTDVFEGLSLGLSNLDPGRASAVLLVTDGVANDGIVDGPSFAALLENQDARVFGFLMGNSGNWPLMQLVAETSGGFYVPVSNDEDIGAQMAIARDRMSHQALHGFSVEVDGGGAHALTRVPGVANHGEQIVVVGRYTEGGRVDVRASAVMTGRPTSYSASFTLPDVDETYPELERMWAIAAVDAHEYERDVGIVEPHTVADDIERIGVEFQIVTEETSMILLTDADFDRLGIDRRNRERTLTEEEARALREDAQVVGGDGPEVGPGGSAGGGSGGGFSGGGGGGGGSWGGGALTAADLAWALAIVAFLVWRRRPKARS